MKWLENMSWQRVWGLVPSISFDWPLALWLLLLVPLMIAGYILLLMRRRKSAFRYSNLALVKEAAQVASWRRHIPPALMLAAPPWTAAMPEAQWRLSATPGMFVRPRSTAA